MIFIAMISNFRGDLADMVSGDVDCGRPQWHEGSARANAAECSDGFG